MKVLLFISILCYNKREYKHVENAKITLAFPVKSYIGVECVFSREKWMEFL